MTSEGWASRAACRFQPSELFFPDCSEHVEPARKICKGCEVRRDCLDYALRLNIEHGVFGGLSPLQRKRLRRKKRRAA